MREKKKKGKKRKKHQYQDSKRHKKRVGKLQGGRK